MYQDQLVSILIPTYNREHIIKETIESALAQTYENIEIIIVDNASTDNTWSIIQEYVQQDSRIKAFKNTTNIGPVRNWKRCVDEACGLYGKILWSDDIIAPTFLEKTVPFLQNNSRLGFVFTGTEIFYDGTNKKLDSYFIGETGIYDSEKYIQGVLFEETYPVSPGCALFRLNDLKNNLLIDIPNKIGSDFSIHAIGNDLLLFLLTAYQYEQFAFINEKLSFFRAHEGSISVQSNRGKLPLHYDLAAAYFIENFRPDLIKKMNAKLWIHIKQYPIAEKYNLNLISNFYIINNELRLDILYLLTRIIKIYTIKFLNLFRIVRAKLC